MKPLYDTDTAVRIVAERTFLKTLGGGCSAPVAVKTELVKLTGCKYKLILTGAVWSLDGVDELKDTRDCELQIANNKHCSLCPYRDGASENVKDTDIECLQVCNKRYNTVIENETGVNENNNGDASEEPVCKRMKLNKDADVPNNSTNLLKEVDPHDKCPVVLPIGVDFMGKCPYLECQATSKCPVGGHIEGVNSSDFDKCPYMSAGKIKFKTESESKQEQPNENLFCGLVPNSDVSIQTFKDAEKLGKDLAENLISKGANEIMANAQAIIRNT